MPNSQAHVEDHQRNGGPNDVESEVGHCDVDRQLDRDGDDSQDKSIVSNLRGLHISDVGDNTGKTQRHKKSLIPDRGTGRISDNDKAAWSTIGKVVVTTALGYIPGVGGILSAFVGLLWPSPSQPAPTPGPTLDEIWEYIRQEVEELIGKEISEALFHLRRDRLDECVSRVQTYLEFIEEGALPTTIGEKWEAAHVYFRGLQKTFKDTEPDQLQYQWARSILFCHFAVLHANLLRDLVLHGHDWWVDEANYRVFTKHAEEDFKVYINHFDDIIQNQRTILQANAPTSWNSIRGHFNHWNEFERQAVLLVHDYKVIVKSSDPFANPNLVADFPFQEVYSGAVGNPSTRVDATVRTESQNGQIWGGVWTGPSRQFRSIEVGGKGDALALANFNWLPGTGPRHHWTGRVVPSTEIIADPALGQVTWSRVVTIPDPGPSKAFNISSATVLFGHGNDTVIGLRLNMDDGSSIIPWHFPVNSSDYQATYECEGRKVSLVAMWTLHASNLNVGTVIIGFSKDTVETPLDVLEHLYITAIGDLPQALESRITGDKKKLKKAKEVYWKALRKDCEERSKSKSKSK